MVAAPRRRARLIALAAGSVMIATAVVATVVITDDSPAVAGPGLPGTSSPQPDRVVLTLTTTPDVSQAITWRTDEPTTEGIAEVTAPDGTTRQVEAESIIDRLPGSRFSARHHTALVDDLEPATTYEYRVGGPAGWSQPHTFTTAPAASDDVEAPWTFLYYGDAQLGLDAGWAAVAELGEQVAPDAALTLHAGDLVNDGNDDSQWGAWFAAVADGAARRPVLAVPGNHELYGDPALERYRSQFAFPTNGPDGYDETAWYVDRGGVRFVTLDGNLPDGNGAEQARWLRGVLRDNPMRWTVVSFHQPMFSAAKLRDNKAQRDAFLSILEQYDVDLVLQGHDHAYARGYVRPDGPAYVVANAGDKYYPLDAVDLNDWERHDAVRVVAGDQVSTVQSVRVEADRLVVTSTVGAVGPGAVRVDREGRSQPIRVGDVIDTFTVAD